MSERQVAKGGGASNVPYGKVIDYVITLIFVRRRWRETIVSDTSPGVALNSRKLKDTNKRELINAHNLQYICFL